MRWVGQHIVDLIARFRYYVYFEKLDRSDSKASLVVDENGKVGLNAEVSHGGVDSVEGNDTTYIDVLPVNPTTGNVVISASLNATDGTADSTTRFLSKDNTWDVPTHPATGVTTFTNVNGTYISSGTVNTSATGAVTIGTTDLSAVDGTSDINTKFLSKDNTWDTPSYTGAGVTTFTSVAGTYINITANSASTGAVGLGTVDLNAVDGTSASDTRFLSKDNTWDVVTFPAAYALPLAADGTRGGVQIGYSENAQNYPVELSSEKMFVNVPWTDTAYTLPAATTFDLGGIKLGYVDNNRNYAVALTQNMGYVNVPWTDTQTAARLAGTGLDLSVNTINANVDGVQSVAATNSSTTSARTYKVQVDASDKLVVNVPWADTQNPHQTITGTGSSNTDSGIKLSDSGGTVLVLGAGSVTAAQSGNTITLTGTDTQGVTTVTTTSGTFIDLTPTTPQVGAVDVRADLSATGTAGSVTFLRGDNTWQKPFVLLTSSTIGVAKIEDDTVQSVAAQAVTATANKTYGVQNNSTGQLVVNVPWTDTDPAEFVTKFSNVNGTYVSASTVNTGAMGAVSVGTLDLSAVDGTSASDTRFLSKDNTWDIPSYPAPNTANKVFSMFTCSATTVTSATDGVGAAVVMGFDTEAVSGGVSATMVIYGSGGIPSVGNSAFTILYEGPADTTYLELTWNVTSNTNTVNNRLLSGIRMQKGILSRGAIQWSTIDPTTSYIYDRGTGNIRKGSTAGSVIFKILGSGSPVGTYFRMQYWKEESSVATVKSESVLNGTQLSIKQLK